ncbi:MAG: hypothetical protein Ct9H300mP28_38080 [Pseudomonadota bacterium]|nr:MAG: hypothetical protein Ct9H300mP28_38080 [Pseudomonadota bacterium]
MFEPIVVKALQEYAWPGNFRELENVIEGLYSGNNIVLRGRAFRRNFFRKNNSSKLRWI